MDNMEQQTLMAPWVLNLLIGSKIKEQFDLMKIMCFS